MSDLMHYAEGPVTLERDWTYVQHEPSTFGKPVGFWVSVLGYDDWPTWCRDNEFGDSRLITAHRVTLADDANVLRLDSPVEMLAFAESCSVETDWDRRFPWRSDWSKWPIDWRAVAQVYDGIVIAPYQWSQRNNLDWYYGWDCASGCIWNLSAIASVEHVGALVGGAE